MTASTPRSIFHKPAVLLAIILTTLLAGLTSPAAAQLSLIRNAGRANASGVFFGTGLPPRMDETTFGPFGGVAVADVSPFGQSRVRAVQTGFGLNAVTAEALQLSDIPGFDFTAGTNIDLTVLNTAASGREPLLFEYLINGGELRISRPGGRFDDLEATVAVSIFVLAPDFSGFLWDWGVTLRGDGESANAHVHGFGSIFDLHDPLNLGTPDISPVTITDDEAILSIAPFTAFADLGEMQPGRSSTITYSMFAHTSGRALNLTSAEATLGDPFNLAENPASIISIRNVDLTTVIPEP